MKDRQRIVSRIHVSQRECHPVQHAVKQRRIAVGERRGAGLNVDGTEEAGQFDGSQALSGFS
jgi:hypothetical protein